MELNLDASPVFYRNAISKAKIVANQGGTRSSKTYSLMQLVIVSAWKIPNEVWSVVSVTIKHLKKGVIRDFLQIMKDLGIYDDDCFNKSDLIYEFPNGTIVEFFSADMPEKLRGSGRDKLFINEANLISHAAFVQLLIRTKKKIYIDYNPADYDHWIYDKVLTRPDCELIVSTYKDAIDFIPKEQVEEIERLEKTDPDYYKVYGLGERVQLKNTIYTRYSINNVKHTNESFFGIDFGFASSQTAVVELSFNEGQIFIDEVIYEKGLHIDQLAKQLKDLGIERKRCFCDAADPRSIAELRKFSINAQPAIKEVRNGIEFLQRFDLIISPESKNLIKEIKGYKFREDIDGKIYPEPVKLNDHAMDAMRYAAYSAYQKYGQRLLGDKSLIQKRNNYKPRERKRNASFF